jgi:hypothetical protein
LNRLGDLQVESKLLDQFFSSTDSLRFIDRMDGKANLPRCTAVFRLAHPQSSSHTLRLEISYVENGCGEYIRDGHRWDVLRDGEEEPTKILDIRVLDMENR